VFFSFSFVLERMLFGVFLVPFQEEEILDYIAKGLFIGAPAGMVTRMGGALSKFCVIY